MFLVLFCLGVYGVGQRGIPAIDRDESRFAQASRQMMESPDGRGWIVPRVQDRPRLNKPPLIYWLQAGSAAAWTGRMTGRPGPEASARDEIWMYRLPSLAGAVIAVLLAWRLGCAMFDASAGFLGALLLATTPALLWESHQARADVVLLACTTMSTWGLWRAWREGRDAGRPRVGSLLLLWGGVALGVLTKGPITPLVVGLGALALSGVTGRWRWMWRARPILGLLLVASCVGPWVYLVAREVGVDRYASLVWDETIGRGLHAQESHRGPPGYHLALLPVLLGAGSMLGGASLVRAWRVGWRRTQGRWAGREPELFLLCVIIPSWVVFELSSTKLPHYTMPLYPALTLLAARGVLAADAGRWALARARTVRVLAWTWLAVLALVMLGLGAGVTFVALRVWGAAWSGAAAAAWVGFGALLVTLAVRFLATGRWNHAQRCGIALMAQVGVGVGFVGSNIPEIRLSEQLAERVGEIDPPSSRALACVGYVEDSLVYETRGRAERVEARDLPRWLAEHPTGLVIVDEGTLRGTPSLRSIDSRAGFNYTTGRAVSAHIAERTP